jgi:hypothetical protein
VSPDLTEEGLPNRTKIAPAIHAAAESVFGPDCPSLRLPSWDWKGVKASVAVLAALEPAVLASGHGIRMSEPGVAGELRASSERFSRPRGAGRAPDEPHQ